MKHDEVIGAAVPARRRRAGSGKAPAKEKIPAAETALTPFTPPAKSPKPGARRRPRVLLVFNISWGDARAILMGISRYTHGSWEVLIDTEAAAAHDDRWVRTAEWDGVITRHMSPALVEACRARKIPLIDLNDAPVVKGIPKIRPANHAVGHMGAEYFLERGFKHFAFCGLTEWWARERAAGFMEALGLSGKSCANFEDAYRVVDPKYDAEQQALIQKWLADLPRPLALMACSDLRALQVMGACRKAGYLVPNEVAILGVNNDSLRCAFGNPPLSSVATDRQLAGYRAAELLDRMMVAGQWTGDDDIRIDPIRVVARQSTDVLAIEDRATCAAIHYIRQFACQGITAEDVAKEVGVSRHVLERKFRHLLGRSAHAEIRQIQIARIKQLLIETDMPLKNIADLVGIPHTEYVNVMFSRCVGVTPGTFRRKHQPSRSEARLESSAEPDFKEDF